MDDGHHGGDTGKGHALDQRQFRAEERDAHGLEDGGQAAHEEACGDEQAMSSEDIPAAAPMISGGAMMPPYMVRTCWKP